MAAIASSAFVSTSAACSGSELDAMTEVPPIAGCGRTAPSGATLERRFSGLVRLWAAPA